MRAHCRRRQKDASAQCTVSPLKMPRPTNRMVVVVVVVVVVRTRLAGDVVV
jgi:hypothetical protein